MAAGIVKLGQKNGVGCQMEEKKIENRGILKGFLICVLLVALIFGGVKIYRYKHPPKEEVIQQYIERNYLHEVDEQAVDDGKYAGMLAALNDPYTMYYTESAYTSQKQSNDGVYKGIGVVMQENKETGEVIIVRCYGDSPGEQAGLLPGDIIAQVNGTNVTLDNQDDMIQEIRDSSEVSVHLGIRRDGEESLVEVDLTQAEINIPYVEHRMLDDNVGYLAMYEFTATTAEQFQAAMTDLQEQGMEKLIIDLRSNPGGLLTSVTEILESILPKGLIVYTEDKNGNRQEYSGAGETPLSIPLVVLVNQYSASASEIFAGAVKDYELGTLVGMTTYGKGVVQSIIPLGDGTGIKLTTANYYTPKGTNIDGTGITPDVEVELDDSIENAVQGDPNTDNQLQKAMEILGQ
ncbi:MAG: S41 family peptidase [Lachnospiraceae bacterium]|nr:S41 family peptidase [Lachnospiraceae bacterium]